MEWSINHAGWFGSGKNGDMHIPARVDYAVRAVLELAQQGEPMTGDALAEAQSLPVKFLKLIMNDLRRAGVVISRRGLDGGYRLARTAAQITVADVMRAIDGPLAEVHGLRPELRSYQGSAEHLQDVWIATRASLRVVLESLTIEDVLTGKFPKAVAKLVADPDAWLPRAR